MFILERSFPIPAQKEEALLRRLPQTHKKRGAIEDSLEKAKAGFRGEVNLDYHLSFLPEKNYLLFNGLRLIYDHKAFQLDSLLLTAYFGLIIENKNIAGTLTFEKFNQMIRMKDQKEQGFLDPIAQARRQLHQLQKWLDLHKIKPIPLDYLITISNPSTILKTSIERIGLTDKVMHAIHIPDKIKELEQKYMNPALSPYYLQKLSQLILQEHTPAPFDILLHYQISKEEILKGVQCPACHFLPMVKERNQSNWRCPNCLLTSQTAYQQAIDDYFHLISATITNPQCRDFLILPSRNIAYKLLASMNLESKGSTKGRVYYRQHRA
ncbi:nuclease-related domain-containing protein [Ammoniphilus sp. 3BR4]